MPRRFYIIVLVFCLLVMAATTHKLRAHAMGHYISTQRYEDVYYLPPANWLPLFSLGYRRALADLIWMKALVYFGEEFVHKGEVKYLYQYAESMLSLDKHFRAVYRWVGISALYRSGTITIKDAYRAISYLERGLRVFPDDGEMAWSLGATYVYELAPVIKEPEEKKKVRSKGMPYLQAAALRGAGPAWLALSNASQLAKLGKTQQAIQHLQTLYATTYDPEKRKKIEDRLKGLFNYAHVEAMKHTVEEHLAALKKDFPYLSSTMYLLVGPRPPFDAIGFLKRNFDPLADVVKEADFQP